MQLTRILPTPAQLAADAIAGTAFVAEITVGADIRISAELCAELSAEAWETAHHAIPGATIDSDVTSATAQILTDQGAALRHLNVEALYAADAKLEKAISTLSALRRTIDGKLPVADATAEMAGIDGDIANAIDKLKRASLFLGIEIDRAEIAASKRRREGMI